jgi:uncharacterized protein (DUF58 family)
MLVYPEAAALVGSFLGRKRLRSQGQAHAARDPMFRRSGSSFDLKNIRDYEPSDDPRRIDWRLAARTGRLYIKEYYEEEREGAAVLVDLSASMGCFGDAGGRGDAMCDTEARRMAASLAWMVSALGMPMSLFAFSASVLRRLDSPRPGAPRARIESFFAGLEVRGEGRTTRIAEAVRAARSSTRYGRLILVSDFLDADYDPRPRVFPQNAFIRLYRPLSPPGRGAEARILDPETGVELRLPWDAEAADLYRRKEAELEGKLGEAAKRGAFYRIHRPGASHVALLESFLGALYA